MQTITSYSATGSITVHSLSLYAGGLLSNSGDGSQNAGGGSQAGITLINYGGLPANAPVQINEVIYTVLDSPVLTSVSTGSDGTVIVVGTTTITLIDNSAQVTLVPLSGGIIYFGGALVALFSQRFRKSR